MRRKTRLNGRSPWYDLKAPPGERTHPGQLSIPGSGDVVTRTRWREGLEFEGHPKRQGREADDPTRQRLGISLSSNDEHA